MPWRAFYKDGRSEREEDGVERPVKAGNDGELICIAQEEGNIKVAVDLLNGVICLGYDTLDMIDGNLNLTNAGAIFHVCEDTNIVGEFKHMKSDFLPAYNCNKTKHITWFKCLELVTLASGQVVECDTRGGSATNEPCDNGHARVEGTREVTCDPVGATEPVPCDQGHERVPLLQADGVVPVTVRVDTLFPLVWRPIWFTRNTNGIETKVIGVQTTTPTEIDNDGKDRGSRNVKKIVSIFSDGRLGIS